jgi:hypothetical protein
MNISIIIENAIAAVTLVALTVGGNATAGAETIVTMPEPETVTESVVKPEPEPTVQDVLLAVCESRGYDESCAKTLLGMVWVESNNISTAVGDQGRARGYFQIWTKLHGIPVSCAEDLVCSADWTVTYLEYNQYPKYVSYAVQCHNSCNAGNGYDAKVARHGERLWNEPLAVTQAATIDLTSLAPKQTAATTL